MGSRVLLADGDQRSLRLLEAALQSAGFAVETAANGEDAWRHLATAIPDVVVADSGLAGIDGFELCARVRKLKPSAGLPFIILVADETLEKKILTLEAGADDYIVKPASVQEVVARVRARLKRWRRDRLAAAGQTGADGAGEASSVGELRDLGLVDLLEVVESNARSGILHLHGAGGAAGAIYLRNGRVVDAEVGRLSAIDALARLFGWDDGNFEFEWKSIRRKDVIERPTPELIRAGMQRLDEWNRLSTSFGDRQRIFEVDYHLLAERLAEVPDDLNGILRLCDGVRPIGQVIEQAAIPDAEALTALIRLRDEGIIYDVLEREAAPRRHAHGARASTSVPRPKSFVPEPAPREREPAAEFLGAGQGDTFGPPRRRTAPGLGEAMKADRDAAATPARTLRSSDAQSDGIPEARLPQDNVARFAAIEETRLRAELVAAADGGTLPVNPTLPVQTPAPHASAGAPTQRGFAASVRPGLSLDGPIPAGAVHNPPVARRGDEAIPSAVVKVGSGRAVVDVDSTTRVRFPDDQLTRNEALDELGLPSRWRALRFLAVAVLVGGGAAVGVQRLRARSAAMGPPSEDGRTASPIAEHAVAEPTPPAPAQEAARPTPAGAAAEAGFVGSAAAPEPPTDAASAAPTGGAGGGGTVEPVAAAVALPDPAVVAGAAGTTSPPGADGVNAPAPVAEGAAAKPTFAAQLADCRSAFTKNRMREAQQACSAAVAANPRSAEALTILAHAELNRGHLSKAADLATRAIEADADVADAYVIIGGVRQDSGQNAEAKAAYRRYLQLAPRGRYADELRSILNGL